MSSEITPQFINALRTLEETKETEALTALYASEATIGNVLAPDQFQGAEGAKQFWSEYRGAFQKVASTFRNIISTDDGTALEWTSEGTTMEGKSFLYSGVTILEISGGKIVRSAAYFDPKAI